MKLIHERRLLNVARALMESPQPEHFTMTSFSSYEPCGTPACALGHYAWRTDLQSTFRLNEDGNIRTKSHDLIAAAMTHFGITSAEYAGLFSAWGCNYANTPEQAARYIVDFVERKRRGSPVAAKVDP